MRTEQAVRLGFLVGALVLGSSVAVQAAVCQPVVATMPAYIDPRVEVLRDQIEAAVSDGVRNAGAVDVHVTDDQLRALEDEESCVGMSCVQDIANAVGARFVLRIVVQKRRLYRLSVELLDGHSGLMLRATQGPILEAARTVRDLLCPEIIEGTADAAVPSVGRRP